MALLRPNPPKPLLLRRQLLAAVRRTRQVRRLPPGNGTRVLAGTDLPSHPPMGPPRSPAPNNGNGSAASSGFNQLRNEFLTAARRVATTKKQAIGEVVEWASGGAFKYGDIGRMTEAICPSCGRPLNSWRQPSLAHLAERCLSRTCFIWSYSSRLCLCHQGKNPRSVNH